MTALVGQADGQFGDAERLSQPRGGAMQADVGLTAVVAPHFDLPPAHVADTGAESLSDGFFGGPASGQGFGAAGAVITFGFSEDAFEEAIAVPGKGVLDALDFNEIDTYGNHVDASVLEVYRGAESAAPVDLSA